METHGFEEEMEMDACGRNTKCKHGKVTQGNFKQGLKSRIRAAVLPNEYRAPPLPATLIETVMISTRMIRIEQIVTYIIECMPLSIVVHPDL